MDRAEVRGELEEQVNDDWVSTGSLLFLIGSVLSFAVAIGSGLYLNIPTLSRFGQNSSSCGKRLAVGLSVSVP